MRACRCWAAVRCGNRLKCWNTKPTTYFDIWLLADPPLVRLEHDAPRSWAAGLRARGYEVVDSPPGDQAFGHAQVISVRPDGMLAGVADPRSGDGAFTGM